MYVHVHKCIRVNLVGFLFSVLFFYWGDFLYVKNVYLNCIINCVLLISYLYQSKYGSILNESDNDFSKVKVEFAVSYF